MSRAGEPPPEHAAIVAKVDAFAAAVEARRREDMACGSGCAGCCHVDLEVSPLEAAAVVRALEALGDEARERVRARGRGGTEAEAGARCVMLEEDDRCAIYAARPLVCRTQGLPLAYPAGWVPEEALSGRGADGRDLTWCPLNFTQRPPAAEDVLDATRVDTLLALVGRRFAEAEGLDPEGRVALRVLAAAPNREVAGGVD